MRTKRRDPRRRIDGPKETRCVHGWRVFSPSEQGLVVERCLEQRTSKSLSFSSLLFRVPRSLQRRCPSSRSSPSVLSRSPSTSFLVFLVFLVVVIVHFRSSPRLLAVSGGATREEILEMPDSFIKGETMPTSRSLWSHELSWLLHSVLCLAT